MAMKDPASNLDFYDPGFLADPYPALGRVREATPIFRNEQTGQWMLTRFGDVYETLRDRRLGRVYHHMYNHAELGQPAPDPRWGAFHRHERWSLLSLEPPDHTRIRKLVSKVFTSRSVTVLTPVIAELSRALIDRCREMGTFDLLADYAQRYSVAVVGEVLGVPRADTQRLLDWSHAIVKMYELSASDELKARANAASGEFIDYTRALIAAKRRPPTTAWSRSSRRPRTAATGSATTRSCPPRWCCWRRVTRPRSTPWATA